MCLPKILTAKYVVMVTTPHIKVKQRQPTDQFSISWAHQYIRQLEKRVHALVGLKIGQGE
jgi:hypothetical protein